MMVTGWRVLSEDAAANTIRGDIQVIMTGSKCEYVDSTGVF